MKRSTAADEERLAFRPPEFSRRTGLSKTAVYDAIARGNLKATRLGKSILIPPSELQRVLKMRENPVPQTPDVKQNPNHPAKRLSIRLLLQMVLEDLEELNESVQSLQMSVEDFENLIRTRFR